MTQYMLHNAEPRQRLAALQAYLDPDTIHHLEALGVGAGWRCLDVGAGGGSIAAWLCERVGPTGRVVATDIDTRLLNELRQPNLEVRRHDITTDPLEEAAFDLVHARGLLEHLPARDQALRRMVAALKPGGRLLVTSADYVSWTPTTCADAGRAARFLKASAAAFRFVPFDECYGRRLTAVLQGHGLADVSAAGHVQVVAGGSPAAGIWRFIWTGLREQLLSEGVLTAAELDDFLALHDAPDFAWLGPIVMSAWGRRPAG